MWKTPDGRKPDDYILPNEPVPFCIKGSAFEDRRPGIEVHTGRWYITEAGTITKFVMNSKSMFKEQTTYIDIHGFEYNYKGQCREKPFLDIVGELPADLRYDIYKLIYNFYDDSVVKGVKNG